MLPSEEIRFPFVWGIYLFGKKLSFFLMGFWLVLTNKIPLKKKDYLILGDAADTKRGFAVMPQRDIVFQD